MKCPKWIASLGVVLGLATGAHAYVYRISELGAATLPYKWDAIDTYLVECNDSRTNLVVASGRNLYYSRDDFFLHAIGFTGSLAGQVDAEWFPFTGDYQRYGIFSVPAWVKRTGTTQGATKALVEVVHYIGDMYDNIAAAYLLQFSCLDAGFQEVGDPTVTALQDQ